MAFKNYIAFGAGEISPGLFERGNLDKFRTGLMRGRNCNVTKLGGLRNREGFVKFFTPSNNNPTKYHTVLNRGMLFEFRTDGYSWHYNFDPITKTFGNTLVDVYPRNVTYTADQLKNLHFANTDTTLYVACEGKVMWQFNFNAISVGVTDFTPPVKPDMAGYAIFTVQTTGPASGYDVDYGVTYVDNGVETFIQKLDSTGKLPLANQHNTLIVSLPKVSPAPGNPDTDISQEVRFYRRERGFGTWGFIGNSSAVLDGPNWNYTYKDIGGAADYLNSPPDTVSFFDTDAELVPNPGGPGQILEWRPKTVYVYQSRVIISGTTDKSKVFASRTNSEAMTRDYPIQDDSALVFKNGSDGGARVGRMFDGRGLVLTTDTGVYETPNTALLPSTAYSTKRSSVVHDDTLPVIGMGSSMFVKDLRLSGLFALTPSDSGDKFVPTEVSIFSEHLLANFKIVSWAVQDEVSQTLWMVRDDGKLVSVTYQEDQQVNAWTWHDTDGFVDQVFIMRLPREKDLVVIRVLRNGNYYLEYLADRNTAHFIDHVFCDGAKLYKNQMITSNDTLVLSPEDPDDWTGSFTVAMGGTTPFSDTPGKGAVGSVFRVFDETFTMSFDMEVTEYVDTANLKVSVSRDPRSVLPDAVYTDGSGDHLGITELYETFQTLTGLGHLEGKKVSVRLDGFTHASPLNTDKQFDEYTVASGQIVLNDVRGAIIAVGLPYATDVQTLEVDTIEQSPVKLESQVANKLHVSYLNSRSVYYASKYPSDDTVTGMENNDMAMEPESGIDPTTAPQPYTGRLEHIVEGSYEARGSMAMRNVDPQPVGLRAVILDEEVIGRGR